MKLPPIALIGLVLPFLVSASRPSAPSGALAGPAIRVSVPSDLGAFYRTQPPRFRAVVFLSRLEVAVTQASLQTGLDRALIEAVIRVESGFNPAAISRAGAGGLMQLMPGTARELGVTDRFDVHQNVLGGSRYLKRLYRRFGTIELALAAYNAGPGRVLRAGGIPKIEETRRYVHRVMSHL